jgi:simple sugar transport system permease protein
MLFQHTLMVYAAFLFVPLMTFVINRTTFGVNVRAIGENPAAADSLGVSVARVRYTALIIGNGLAGLAGAALAIELGIFQQNLTNAMGFIAIALVYFGAWRPLGVMAGSLVFGLVGAVVLQCKTLGIIPRSASDLAAMAPAVITIIALILVANRFRQPSALTKPYVRGG